MTLRRISLCLTAVMWLLCGQTALFAQQGGRPVILRAADRILSSGRIAAAGRVPDIALPPSDTPSPFPMADPVGDRSASDDFDFTQYLLESGLTDDALVLLGSSGYAPSDTLSWLRAWTLYSTRHFGQALEYMREIPAVSPFGERALFYGAAASARLGDYDGALGMLSGYSGAQTALRDLQQAGVHLLKGEPEQAVIVMDRIPDQCHYAVAEALDDMRMRASQAPGRGRSPFLGAALSAVVPGLGKIYAGRTGEGVMSLLSIGALAAVTAENWSRSGPGDWRTVLFGSVGAVLYLGNIYGSAVAVRRYNYYTSAGYETAVLVDIHLPLRSIFL